MFDREQYELDQMEYLKANADIYIYYNPHPNQKLVGDCVKRSLVKATGKDYMELQRELNALKKITKAKKFNGNKNWLYYVEKILKGIKLPEYRNMKIGDFAKLDKSGTYIISCRKHLVCVQDGKLYDTWNSSFKAIGRVWLIEN